MPDMLPLLLFLITAPVADRNLARDIFRELIELDTTHSTGDTTKAAEAMAARLRAGGFAPEEMEVVGPATRGNLVVRFRGTDPSRKPLLLLAHLDVVEARREDWSVDPFRFLEREGYYYGRGTGDDKGMAAIWVANLLRYKREGYRPARDLIVALTADEETGDVKQNGVEWLLKNRRDLIDAELCLNEGGGGQLKNGKRLLNQVQVAEKANMNVQLEVRNKGGHSSMPLRENAIYRLTKALERLEEYEFPVQLNAVTRAFFERMASLETGQTASDMKALVRPQPDLEAARRLAASPYYNAQMRTTCVATRLDAGHADNALPQIARAVVNCRLLPGVTLAEILSNLERIVADKQIAITVRSAPKLSSPSAMEPKLFQTIERLTAKFWPGVPAVPVQSTGGSDARDLRSAGIPTYGVSGIFEDMDDIRWHGRDERIGVEAFHEGQEFLYELVKELGGS
jgi:acetylornithine deacetylase/succinyl-diaminopimelate desuccinylase-like protein